MSKKWHKGPPPSVGWWPASDGRMPDYYRWWNGFFWSRPAQSWMASAEAAHEAQFPNSRPESIEWTNRPASWPARSRT